MRTITKFSKFILVVPSMVLILGLFVVMPHMVAADDYPFQVTEQPVAASYKINETAVPLSATFEYTTGLGSIDSKVPITVRWFWSYENTNTDRSNGFAETTVEYSRLIKHTTTHTPATDVAGVKYYYAVISYAESVYINQGWTAEPRETVTAPVRVQVAEQSAGRDFWRVGDSSDDWAVVNLVLCVVGAIIALLSIVRAIFWRAKDEQQRYERLIINPITLVLSVILAVAGVVVFILTENMSLNMVIADFWTIVNAVIFILLVICVICTFKKERIDSRRTRVEASARRH